MVKALSDFSIMKAIVIEMTTSESELLDQIQDFAPYCDHFLLDFDKNGLSWSELQSGSVLSVELVKTLCEKYSILIGINCPAVDLDDLLNELNPTGLNVKGGEEEQVGMKSFDELDEVFEVIEVLV
jgi:phosphoribosylanthranilate isomerase